jgi:diguanylate cyclase (GGDEF)-like protein/PAS domain S-box-containing protein
MSISKNFYHTLINNLLSGYAYHKIIKDEEGNPIDYQYIDINDMYCELIGVKKEEVIGKKVSEIIPLITNENFNWIDFFGKVAIEGGSDSTIQFFKPFNRWYKVNVFSLEEGYFAEVFIDVTELKEQEILLQNNNEELNALYEEVTASEEELRQQNNKIIKLYDNLTLSEKELRQQNELLKKSNTIIKEKEQVYKLISEASDDVVWYWNLQTGDYNMDVEWFDEIGINADQFTDFNRWHEIVHPEDINDEKQALYDYLTGNSERYESTYRVRTIKGDYRWIRTRGKAIFDNAMKPYILAGAHIDITDKKLKEEKINYLAYYDSLTNMPNRTSLWEKLDECLYKNKQLVSIALMDIDNFKSINDSLGFTIGDNILKEMGARLKCAIDDDDFIARLGGDEFAAVFYNIKNNEEIYNRAKKLKECFNKPVIVDNAIHQLTVSIGISVFPCDGTDHSELIKNADTALMDAKNIGKNKISFFTNEMKEEFLKKVNMEKYLTQALINKEFKLYYQPQFEIETGQIRGFEALIRWFNPILGFVSPMLFIPIAEETGLINEIGEWVLQEACKQYMSWNRELGYEGIISVNISPVQLKNNNFLHVVSKVLESTNIKLGCLELEITENLFIDALESAKLLLEELAALGIKISLDDFGTGYSSLSYLKSLPIDTLKIDKSFIQNTGHEGVDREITSAVINMVRKIGIETIAEGVEDSKQLEFLTKSYCDNIQGYLTGRPMPPDEIRKVIDQGKIDIQKYIHNEKIE